MSNAAPYPADTRAKGWRFELDYEAIDQSDTWDIAAEIPMAQHALLMMWLVAWRQQPCGSFPNDEAAIRAKCRIPQSVWAKCRDVCMRGWWLADDGRLYHDTLTKRVCEMIDYRKKNADRVAAFKAAQREQRAGNALLTGEQPAKNDTGTGTGTGTKEENTPTPRKRGTVHEFPPGFDQVWLAYPRKVGKDAAAKAFAKRKPDAALVETMVKAIEAQRSSPDWTKDGGQFIPHLATWLNGGRWMDEVGSPAAANDIFAGAR